MNFVNFMRGTGGRVLRIAAGVVLAVVGLAVVGDLGGVILALLGAVMVAAGVVNFCLLAPLFGIDLKGRPKHASQ